jgi:hypothetical protein
LLDTARVRPLLQAFDFNTLFLEELGGDHHANRFLVMVDGPSFRFEAVAEKRGLAVYVCAPGAGGSIPDYATRRKIERQVAKSAYEHIIIYLDKAQTTQIWQWVKREAGRPAACREHAYHRDQAGDALVQKLQALVIGIEQEADLTLLDVTRGVRGAFDVERVTKRFYDLFKGEHTSFLAF